MKTNRPARWWLLLVAAFLTPTAGCLDGDDDDGTTPPRPTLENVWPNADGNAWIYGLAMSAREGTGVAVYATEAEVPPLPGWEELAALLAAPAAGAPADSGAGVMRLRFDGQITTEGGATAQNLVEEYYERGGDGLARLTVLPGAALWRALAAARPAVAAALRVADEPGIAAAVGYFDASLFLHGYAWEKTGEWIAGYGDLDDQVSWLFLEDDLEPGHAFSLQLVPALADDIFLRARIADRRDVTVDAGTFRDCVECLYAVDYGVQELTDEEGTSLGYCRPLSIGTIVYAPGVGPVYSRERHLRPADSLLGAGYGRLDNEAWLIGSARP